MGRHLILALAGWAVVAAPQAGFAQQRTQPREPSTGAPASAPRTVAPPIVMPFGPLASPPSGGLPSRENPPFNTPAPPLFFPVLSPPWYPPYPVGPTFPYTPASDVAVDRVRTPPPLVERGAGWLRLDVTPDSAEVWIDSAFVGTVADINARRLFSLDPGRHRISIRADGYAPLAFDIQIVVNDTVTYRATLERRQPGGQAPSAPSVSRSVLYVIPGCYAGNVAPRASLLPAGCDIARVQIRK